MKKNIIDDQVTGWSLFQYCENYKKKQRKSHMKTNI